MKNYFKSIYNFILNKMEEHKQITKLLKLAEEILKDNENCCLTGTLMLKLRGIDLGRVPKDIDILICDYAPTIILDPKWKLLPASCTSDGTGVKYEYDGILLDVMSRDEQTEIFKGWRLGNMDALMEAKLLYSQQPNDQAEKHKQDLIKLGYDFSKNANKDN